MKKLLLTTLTALSVVGISFTLTTAPYSCPNGVVIQVTPGFSTSVYNAQCPDTTPALKPAIVISRYQGTKVASDSNEGIVQVNIPTSAEGKTLVLAGYENINWIISNPNNIKVVKIIATNGEYSGTIRVTGAVSGIQVETYKVVPYPGSAGEPFDQNAFTKFSDWLKTKGLSVAKEDFNGGGANTGEQVVVLTNVDLPPQGQTPSAEIRIKSTQYEVPSTSDTVFEGEPLVVTVKGRWATRCTLSSKAGQISIQPNGSYTNYDGINYTYTIASASQTANYITSKVTNSAGYVRYYAQFTAVCYNQDIASAPASYSVEVARAALTPKEPTCPAGQRYDSKEYAKYGTNTCKPGKPFTCADGTVITVHDYPWSNESTYYFQCPVPPVIDKGVLIQTAPTFSNKTDTVGKTNITIPKQAEGKALVLQTTGMVTTDGTNRYHRNNFIISNPNNVKIKRIIIVENLCGDCGFDDGIIPTTASGDISGIKVERWLGDAGVGGASEPKGKMFQYLRTDRLKYIPGLENERYLDLRIRGVSIDPLDVYTASEACLLPYVVANNPTPCAPTEYPKEPSREEVAQKADADAKAKAIAIKNVSTGIIHILANDFGSERHTRGDTKNAPMFSVSENIFAKMFNTTTRYFTYGVRPGESFRFKVDFGAIKADPQAVSAGGLTPYPTSEPITCTVSRDGVIQKTYNDIFPQRVIDGKNDPKQSVVNNSIEYISPTLNVSDQGLKSYTVGPMLYTDSNGNLTTKSSPTSTGAPANYIDYSKIQLPPTPKASVFEIICKGKAYYSGYDGGWASYNYSETLKVEVPIYTFSTQTLPTVTAKYGVTYDGGYGRESKLITNPDMTRDQAVARCASDVSSINSFTSLNSKKPNPICTWGTEQIYPSKNSTAVTVTNDCTMTSVNWPNCQGVGESHSVGSVSNVQQVTPYSSVTGSDSQSQQASDRSPSTPRSASLSSTTKKPYRQFYGSLVQQSRSKVTQEEAARLCNTRISATQSRKDRGLKTYADVAKVRCTWNGEQFYPAKVSTETQAVPQVLGASTDSLCLNVPRNMHRGHNEPREVLRLQSFLAEKGFLEEDNVTGFYGDKTIEAVKDYQASVGLPVTGMTYSLTREAMRMESCR